MLIRCNECKFYDDEKGYCNKNKYPVNENGLCTHAEKVKENNNGKKD